MYSGLLFFFQGDPSPEVILRDLDPQSMILCGLSNSRCSSGNNNSRNEAAANGGSNSLKVKEDKSKLTSSVDLGVLLRYAKLCRNPRG